MQIRRALGATWWPALFIAFMLAGGCNAQAQLVTYDPTALTGTPASFPATQQNANVSVVDITRGSDLTAVAATGSFSSSNWNATTFSSAMSAPGDYYTFTITPAANYTLSFTNITADANATKNGPVTAQWGYGINSFASGLGSATTVHTTGSPGSAAVSSTLSDTGVTTSTEFRMAAWSANKPGDKLDIDASVILSGSATLRATGTLTWDGGFVGNANWSSYLGTAAGNAQSNWNLNNTPLNGDALAFAGSTQTSTNNDISSLTVASITFNSGAGAFTLSGNAITLNSGITNNSSSTETVNLTSITLGGAQTFSAASGNLTIGAAINTNGNALTVNGTSNTTISGVLSGSGSLTKSGTGTLTVSAANTYSGATTINAGTLSLDNAGSTTARLANTSGITLNSGGTLSLTSSSGSSNDRINNSATMTLNGGTFNTGGLSEHGASNNTAGIGALTLQSTSIIDMGNVASIVAFANSHLSSWTGTLKIYNWSGTPLTGGGTDQLYFGNDSTGLTAAQLLEMQFYSGSGTGAYGAGALILANGEVVPIPETPTWISAALVLGTFVGYGTKLRKRTVRFGN